MATAITDRHVLTIQNRHEDSKSCSSVVIIENGGLPIRKQKENGETSSLNNDLKMEAGGEGAGGGGGVEDGEQKT